MLYYIRILRLLWMGILRLTKINVLSQHRFPIFWIIINNKIIEIKWIIFLYINVNYIHTRFPVHRQRLELSTVVYHPRRTRLSTRTFHYHILSSDNLIKNDLEKLRLNLYCQYYTSVSGTEYKNTPKTVFVLDTNHASSILI